MSISRHNNKYQALLRSLLRARSLGNAAQPKAAHDWGSPESRAIDSFPQLPLGRGRRIGHLSPLCCLAVQVREINKYVNLCGHDGMMLEQVRVAKALEQVTHVIHCGCMKSMRATVPFTASLHTTDLCRWRRVTTNSKQFNFRARCYLSPASTSPGLAGER